MSKAVKVIAVIVFLILLGIAGLGIYFAYKYSDGFKTTPKSFYLEINGKRYFENTDGLIYLVFFKGVSQKEIARKENVSKAAITIRIQRILKKLKKLLD